MPTHPAFPAGSRKTWANTGSCQTVLHALKEVDVKHGVRGYLLSLYGDGQHVHCPKSRRSKKRNKPPRAESPSAVSCCVIVMVVGDLLRKSSQQLEPKRPETEFKTQLLKKTDTWIPDIFAAQAADGGMRADESSARDANHSGLDHGAIALVAAL